MGQDALEPILLHLMPDGCSPETECCHMSDKFSGISAMVRAALWFEDQLNLTVLNIGRESFARKDSCTLQCCGTHLLHSIQIDGGWVSLEVTPMDQAEQPQKLLTIGDTKQGWSDLCQLVQALERYQIKDVRERPLGIGTPGNRDSWVIGD